MKHSDNAVTLVMAVDKWGLVLYCSVLFTTTPIAPYQLFPSLPPPDGIFKWPQQRPQFGDSFLVSHSASDNSKVPQPKTHFTMENLAKELDGQRLHVPNLRKTFNSWPQAVNPLLEKLRVEVDQMIQRYVKPAIYLQGSC